MSVTPAATGTATARGTVRRAGDRLLAHAGQQLGVEGVLVDVGRRRTGGAQPPVEVIGHVVFHWGRSWVVVG